MTYKQSHRGVNELNDITKSYNNTYHRSIKKTPESVTNDDRYNFWNL